MLVLDKLTIHKAHELLSKKKTTSEELTKALLKRIEEADGEIKAYVTLNNKEALERSSEIDEKGEFKEYLSGIPVAVKDNICTKDLRTTCASKMLENFVPPYDATVVKKIKEENAFVLGKTNLDEFDMGSSTESSYFFTSRNPWNLERVPGGSSAAAAVAADLAIYALDSDTGGAARQSAAYCGVVGLKPTYGRVSRFGLAGNAGSMDTLATVTKDVRDSAIVLNAISGIDLFDPSSSDMPVSDYLEALNAKLQNVRIGIPKEFLGDGVSKDIKDAILNAAKTFEDMGFICEETSLPNVEYALWVHYVIASAEASSEMCQYDGVRFGHRAQHYENLKDLYKKSRGEGFGLEVKRRTILGTYMLDVNGNDKYLVQAYKLRTLIKQDFEKAFEKYDFLITPTTPTVAFKIGEIKNCLDANNMCTVPVNLAGLPAISIPCGFAEELPIGLQIIGKAFDEAGILQVAYAFEQNTDYHKKQIAWKEA